MTSIRGGAEVKGYGKEPLFQLETDRREERQEKGRLKYEKIQK